MEEQVAAAPATTAGGAPGAPEVSTPQNPVPSAPEAPASSPSEAKDGVEEKGGQAPEEEKLPPFHQDPAWQRLQRRSARNERLVREQASQISQLLEGLKEIKALQKGEEYKPPEKVEQPQDLESAFDDELDSLSQAHSLSPEAQNGVAEIARKYAYTASDGTKIPLPAEQAYQIYQDLNPRKTPTPIEKPVAAPAPAAPKPPASPAPQGMVQRKSLDSIVAEAKRKLGR